ncbi:uncharacterized protein Z519_12774 [Cladophialophora bantiana CBS 173.52]|uniref:Uncharacterized protein n=1 Tax=Cladophialophora bantiana (strain ATCC 10958 / CBS 173.52 / CDC B-1940 / NIH 8579) TaxID=1442370 RepID=A0A0D2HQC6_CLAB1|nr:uncharacterized protein Z519_12774 [Cladophialophora bantiana CBS 173.52]KIW86649.1 hypothetical protein Z519_12774 [Cladophialophora bantiana CBS 173.52]
MAPPFSPSTQDDHNVIIGQVIGQSRLHVTLLGQTPTNINVNLDDGIEYYYCCNEDCDFLWAIQWSPQPRKRCKRPIDLDSYKETAIPRLCRLCREALKKGSVKEGARRRLKQETKQQWGPFETSKKEISGDKSKVMSTTGFEDVPLGDVNERVDKTLAQDLSWDLIEESGANEEWSVINHFGSAAIEHRDAHVDTELVRP